MAAQPPRKGTPSDGEPLWVDADWWRELLRTRDKGPAAEPSAARPTAPPAEPTATATGEAGGPGAHRLDDAPTAPQPRHVQPAVPPGQAGGPAPHEPGVDEPQTADSSAARAPSPPPPEATGPLAPPTTGAPAPPAVPRAKRGSQAVEPASSSRELHVPRVLPPAAARATPVDATAGPTAPAPVKGRPAPAPQAPDDTRPRVVEFLLRHLGDLALLLLAAGVITLVYLVLGR